MRNEIFPLLASILRSVSLTGCFLLFSGMFSSLCLKGFLRFYSGYSGYALSNTPREFPGMEFLKLVKVFFAR